MDQKSRLDQVYKQLADLKADPNAPDRDALMRRLRKEKRSLESALGLREQIVKERKEASSSVRKRRERTPEEKEAKKRRRRSPERALRLEPLSNSEYSRIPPIYAEEIPEELIEALVLMGIRDRRQDPITGYETPLFAFGIRLNEYQQPPETLVNKFEARWGTKPQFFTVLKQGKFQMLAMGPTPGLNA